MSLLLIKTRDLSHQDHTLNFEIMLNPTRSGLLLNKHRGLETRRDKTKQVCEVERHFALKQHAIDQRLVLRKRRELLHRMANKHSYKAEIDEMCREKTLTQETIERHRSAPMNTTGRRKPDGRSQQRSTSKSASFKQSKSTNQNSGNVTKLPNLTDDKIKQISKTGGAFLTESKLPNKLMSVQKPVPSLYKNNGFMRDDSHETLNTYDSKPNVTDDESDVEIESHPHDHLPKTVTFTSEIDKAKNIQEEENERLKTKICDFVEKIEEYRKRPARSYFARVSSGSAPKEQKEDWMMDMEAINGTKKEVKFQEPLVARRYSKINLDMNSLSSAFDKFCVAGKGAVDLQKMVKLASKLKASVKCGRNVSLLPAMSAMKTKRVFMAGMSAEV